MIVISLLLQAPVEHVHDDHVVVAGFDLDKIRRCFQLVELRQAALEKKTSMIDDAGMCCQFFYLRQQVT